jgi:hypothetical protein
MVATDFTSLPKPSLVVDRSLRTRTFRLALHLLQMQLHETQSSFATHFNKARPLRNAFGASAKRARCTDLLGKVLLVNHDWEKSSVDDDARSIRTIVQERFGRENDVTGPLVRVLGAGVLEIVME